MASIKLKFRPSSVKGKKGVLSYQIIHYRLTRLIKTSYRIMPSEWDDYIAAGPAPAGAVPGHPAVQRGARNLPAKSG